MKFSIKHEQTIVTNARTSGDQLVRLFPSPSSTSRGAVTGGGSTSSTKLREQQQHQQQETTTTTTPPPPAISNNNNNSIGTKTIPMSRSLNDYLIKLTMFLMTTIVCSHDHMMRPVNCQKHFFQHLNHLNHHHHHPTATLVQPNHHHSNSQQQQFNHQAPQQQQQQQQQQSQQKQQQQHHHLLPSNHEHILLDERQALDHLMRSQQHQNHHHFITNQPQAADRRHSGANQSGGDGKLLVCYYTTRQSAPYWPTDARGYVVPTSASSDAANNGGQAELRQESGFAPMLQYEPYVVNNNQRNDQRSDSLAGGDPNDNLMGNMKNQQQQLLFKSAAVMQSAHHHHQQQPPVGFGGRSGGPAPAQSGQRQYQEVASPMLASSNHQISISNFNGHEASGGGPRSSKQTPAYSFIGAEYDTNSISGGASTSANNGLIVDAQRHIQATAIGSSSGSAGAAAPPPVSSLAGNNGFIISNKDGGGGGNNNGANSHLERGLFKQQASTANGQQQLVFSPPASLSRAFIVGGTVGVGGGEASSSTTNNEVNLDTKSQLFIPSSAHQQHQHHNNYYLPQQAAASAAAAATNTVSLPHSSSNNNNLYQQQQLETSQQSAQSSLKGKSLQVSAVNSEQLSPVAPSHTFSGAVSGAPSVPLSLASHAAAGSLAAASQQAGLTASLQHQVGYLGRNSQQQSSPALSSSGQLIVGPQHQQQQQQLGAAANGPQSTSKTHSSAATMSAPMKLSFSANDGGKSLSLITNASHHHQQQQQQVPSSSGSTTSGGAPATSIQHLPAPAASSNSLISSSSSSSSPSSPLSSMFDVFGAASQYLMRFKPSSLISPSSFVFNALNSNHHHGLVDHGSGSQHTGLRLSSGSSSSSANDNSSGSLIPLPFTSSLMANLQKTSSSASSGNAANDRSSSGVGILSRFALAQNNQRREDVCGRTIQSPQRRIIGGEGARYGEFPYQVHIKIAKHQCGGALVDKQSIVTAAHCVYHFITRAPVSKLQIVIGAYDIEDEQYQELPPQYFKVNKVKLHPNFRFSASHPDRYDIAILKLDKPVKYTDNVLPVCLPSKDLKFESMVGTVTGFGKTDPSLSNRYGTRLLQKVDVPIIENNECERWHRTRGIDLKIFPEMMCAGYEDGLKDACVGDSGGPLVVKTSNGPGGSRWTLAGITSAGFGCAQSRQPGIYHRVSHTVDWILENLD